MSDLLVFTDLDGTLLDHDDYSYAAAQPQLQRLADLAVPLIFNSSKTAAEIEGLRRQMGNLHPFIVENGSAVYIPATYFDRDGKGEVLTFGADYDEIVDLARSLRKADGFRFRGFADMSAEEVAAATGLEKAQAALAKKRRASEPLLWEDAPERLKIFEREIDRLGLGLLKGGRFYHLMARRVDKGRAMLELLDRYRRFKPSRSWRTAALGDGGNDRAMLEAADIAVVIPPKNGVPLRLKHSGWTIFAHQPGPAGWAEAISTILDSEPQQGD